jgi:ATP-dependent DNA helicase PIF1
MHDQSHTIVRLALHLPFEQPVYFKPGSEEEALLKADQSDTTLTAWFKLNQTDPTAHDYLYHNIPNFFWFVDKKWKKRKKNGSRVIGRMYLANPSEGERYYLRLLLLHVKGACSFEDLRTHNNIVFETFKEAAKSRLLLEDDSEWDRCLNEASLIHMPSNLRNLFCSICVWSNPVDPVHLFENYKELLMEDYLKKYDRFHALNKCLIDFNKYFQVHGKKCSSYSLPEPNNFDYENYESNIDLEKEKQLANLLYAKLNTNQLFVVDTILKSINNYDVKNKNSFFIDGPGKHFCFYFNFSYIIKYSVIIGGTGKTHCYNTLTRILRSEKKNVISVAWTGIAATLLIEGRTVHNIFQILLTLHETSTSSMHLNSKKAKTLIGADLIIWDEAPMAPLQALNTIDRLLRKLMNNDFPFGGKTIVLGGDFRQVTPVVTHANKTKIIENSIKSGKLWKEFKFMNCILT